MKTQLNSFALASWLMAGTALMPGLATAAVHVCTFPGSPSTALDQAVAREAFRTAGIAVSPAPGGFGDDDDGVSLKELNRALGHGCDVIAGFPRSSVADGSGSKPAARNANSSVWIGRHGTPQQRIVSRNIPLAQRCRLRA